MKVKQFKAKNQFILEDEKRTVFHSYDSVIAIVANKVVLGKNWDYSRTTMKYLKQFLEEIFCNNTFTKKDIEKYLKQGFFQSTTGLKVVFKYDESLF